VNRVLTNEAVGGAKIIIGPATATASANGDAILDISGLTDGEHPISVIAPDVFDDTVGPGFPANPSKPRIWCSLKGKVRVAGGRITACEPADGFTLSGARLRAQVRPVWLKVERPVSPRSGPVDMITIHHTAGNLVGDMRTFLFEGTVSVHYLVGPDGAIYKLVEDSKSAAHAGVSFWQGVNGLNSRSIGIEISHKTGAEYPPAQIDAVVGLVQRLAAAFPNIKPGRVIGHSDIGTHKQPQRLGRKSTDPGSAFPWERIEALGLSFQIADGPLRPGIYGGFFDAAPSGRLRSGDNDDAHRYDGAVRPAISGAVRELQTDLQRIGYLCPPDGDFGEITVMALLMFQQHIFSGSRRTGSPDGFNSGDGRLDMRTAEMIKRVLGEVALVA
jgi:N-acetyl-anhydromuramyl-L-alanine amidase AmpD